MMKGMNDTGVTIWKIARIQRAKTYPRYRDRMAAAADLAMSASTLADIENGTRDPLPELLHRPGCGRGARHQREVSAGHYPQDKAQGGREPQAPG